MESRNILKTFFEENNDDSSLIRTHKNAESVIRYYLLFLPPRGCDSILDIGCGISAPYRGVLKTRTKRYDTLDIRPGSRVKYVMDVCDLGYFKSFQYHWGWCSEMIEHVPPNLKEVAVKEIMRVVKNCVFTYPTPKHPTFLGDPGHTEVKINWNKLFGNTHYVTDKTTKTGRAIFILEKLDETNRINFNHMKKK